MGSVTELRSKAPLGGLAKVFSRFSDPEHRAWRLMTMTTNLSGYWAFRQRLSHSRYGRIIPKGDPFFDRKFVTPYLATFFTPADRLAIQTHLCDCLDSLFRDDSFVARLKDGIVLWSADMDGHSQSIVLRLPVRTMLEGDLTIEHSLDGERLYRMSFGFVPGHLIDLPDPQVLFVGGSQGVHGTADKARLAARLNGEITPANMLLIALRAVGQAMGIDQICGVAATHQPVVHAKANLSLGAYDDLWIRNHGEAHARFFAMPAWPSENAVVEGGNKSRTRRKRRLRQALTDQIARDFAVHVVPPAYSLAAE